MAGIAEPVDHFTKWVDHLRADDAAFARASVVHPIDMGEWQGGVYLLTVNEQLWRRVNAAVIETRSLAPVLEELREPSRAWSASETELMTWSLHFWDQNRHSAAFPYTLQDVYFNRWVGACYLRASRVPESARRMAPRSVL